MNNSNEQAKHTPGPWSFRGSLGPSSNPDLKGPHVVEDSAGSQVCIMSGWRSEISESNARLISAAPDLLSALKLFEKFRSQLGKTGATVSIADVASAAQAAIAKAQGRAS